MDKMLSMSLQKAVDDLSFKMANKPERPEKIFLSSITPLSDITAAVVFQWESRRQVVFYFYYVDLQGGKWWHFMPKDGHLLNLDRLKQIRQEVLTHNYKNNCG